MMFPRGILQAPVWTAAVIAFCGIISCRPAVNTGSPTGGSSGSNSGGQSGGGGTSSTGGTAATGGSSPVGGSGGSGGNSSAGGYGGTKATGGSGGTGGAGGSGGTGATTGAGGAAGASTIPDAAPPLPSRGPTKGTTGHNFPFPQNRENPRCIYPALYRNEDVQAAYAKWKADIVTSSGVPSKCPSGCLRVQRPNEPGLEKNSTVSEGIAYGMLIAVYMDDQALFDGLWLYEQQWLDTTGLMNWYINAAGTGLGSNPSGAGPATDADEDMAFALLMADKQWGGNLKALNKSYLDIAKGQITAVWNNEVYQYKYLKPWPATDLPAVNLSYFAPAFYKVFAKVDTANATNWNTLTTTMYGVLATTLNSSNGNADNGLVPAWSDLSGKPNAGAFGATGGTAPTNYQYDSCRVPFRIGLDYCWTGESNAQAYVAKSSKFFATTVGGATKIVDGYALNGDPQAQYQKDAKAQIQSAAFVGPAGVGAMSSSTYQSFVNDAYGVLIKGDAIVGGTYYDESWMVLSLLMMTANFLDYTSI